MKRKKMVTLLAVSVMALGLCGLTGCGNGGDTESTPEQVEQTGKETEGTTEQDGQTGVHTVTFYDSDGTTVLHTEEVEDGSQAEEYLPTKDGYTFTGWFATPQMSHKYDFTAAVTEDVSIFAGFCSYVEDTRTWAIVGSGKSPVLMESNWGKVIGEAQTLEKEDAADANIYRITLDLEAGDEFQFAIDSSWANQRGFGYMATIEQDGKEYFANSGGIGDTGVKKSNIKVAVSGNYTFTLTTYPGEDTYDTEDAYYSEESRENYNYSAYDTITFTYNGEAAGGGTAYQTDYYIKGAKITGWEDVYSDDLKFTEENGIYTLKIALEEGDEFLFTTLLTSEGTQSTGNEYVRYTNIAADDSGSLACVTGTDSANMVAAASGTYTFTYDPATQVLTVAFE